MGIKEVRCKKQWHPQSVDHILTPSQSYLSIIYILTSILPPVLLAAIIRPLSLKTINYLPSGPTAILFSLLAQYHATIPQVYRYRIATSSSDTVESNTSGLTFSDKSLTYLLAGQLALSQLPGSLLAASVGWVVGLAWRYEILLPSKIVEWRIPGWFIGEKMDLHTRARRVEELRRRMDEVVGQGSSSALGSGSGRVDNDARRRA